MPPTRREMWNRPERAIRADTAARCPINEPKLHQIGLIDFFDGVGLLVDRSGDGIHAHRAARIFFEQAWSMIFWSISSKP